MDISFKNIMSKTKKNIPLFWSIGTVLLVCTFLFSLFMGRYTAAPSDVVQALGKLLMGQEADGIPSASGLFTCFPKHGTYFYPNPSVLPCF